MTSKIITYKGLTPKISSQAFIAHGVVIIGGITIGADSGIWFNSVVRGDVASITIGSGTNIQDGTVIHVTRGGHPTSIGNRVTIGHQCLLHACHLQDSCFIGMGSIVMDDSVVETNAMLGAGSLLPPGKIVKSGELWHGRPAKFIRMLSKEEINHIQVSADNYIIHAREYLQLVS